MADVTAHFYIGTDCMGNCYGRGGPHNGEGCKLQHFFHARI